MKNLDDLEQQLRWTAFQYKSTLPDRIYDSMKKTTCTRNCSYNKDNVSTTERNDESKDSDCDTCGSSSSSSNDTDDNAKVMKK
ncbi:hypothetical protein Bhyg_02036, partial [Pseudolycoriella hygida]